MGSALVKLEHAVNSHRVLLKCRLRCSRSGLEILLCRELPEDADPAGPLRTLSSKLLDAIAHESPTELPPAAVCVWSRAQVHPAPGTLHLPMGNVGSLQDIPGKG